MKIRVSDYIAQYLEGLGVERAFMLSGGGMMHLQDSLSRQKKLKYACNHHEQACGYAAESYGRQREALGVCYSTSGPGALNTVTAIVSAYQDSSPVIFLSGQAKLSETIRGARLFGLRQHGTFEADVVSVVTSVTKYAVFLDDPSLVRYHIEKACKLAVSGRPGPVYIEIPVDIQGALIDPKKLKAFNPSEIPKTERWKISEPVPAARAVHQAIKRLLKAKRPLILAGHGIRCAHAAERFNLIASQLNIPVVTTPLAADLMEYTHPLYVGHPGTKGDRAGNFAVQSADVILTLGCSLHALTTGYELNKFAPQAFKIQVEMDPFVLKREKVGVREKIRAGVNPFLDAIENFIEQEEIKGLKSGPWHKHCQMWKKELMVRNEPHTRPPGKINYYDVIDELSELCQGGETLLADAGFAYNILGQAFRTKAKQRLLFSGALAQMGWALPAVTGACFAARNRTVIGVTGDGSLQTNIHELGVISHNKLNAKIIIVNNQGYSCIRNTQKNYFGAFYSGTDSGTGVGFPHLAKLADAYGLPYVSASELIKLRQTLKKVLETPGPVICEVFTIRDQENMPVVTSVRLENGKMESKPLDDMYPFMDSKTRARYLFTD